MVSFFDANQIFFFHKLPKKKYLKGLTIIDCDFFINKNIRNINFLKNVSTDDKIVIIFWNGDLDFFKFKIEIDILQKFNFVELFFVCGSFESKKFQSNSVLKKLSAVSNTKKKYYDKQFYIRSLLSNVNQKFQNILHYKKIINFKKHKGFIFVGKWNFSHDEIYDFTDQYNINRDEIQEILLNLNYFNNLNEKNKSISKIKTTNYLSVNYFLYNIYARKKIVSALIKKKSILIIDDYSYPDFLNQSFKTDSIFIDLGCKCGSWSFYPRNLALKLNYKNNFKYINYFENKLPTNENFKNSINYIDYNVEQYQLNNVFFINNK